MSRIVVALCLLSPCVGCATCECEKILDFLSRIGDDETLWEREEREAENAAIEEERQWILENQSGAYKPIR